MTDHDDCHQQDCWDHRRIPRKEILELGREHADLHGLQRWAIEDAVRSQTTAGWCKYRQRTLELNCDLMVKWPYADVLDVVLHEIAHAKAGSRAGHGRRWKQVAEQVGAEPTRCYESERLAKPDHRWEGTCAACGEITARRVRQPPTFTTCEPCRKQDPDQPWVERVHDWHYLGDDKRPDGKRYLREFRRRWDEFREAYADGTLPPHWGTPKDPYVLFDFYDITDYEFVTDIEHGRIKPLMPDDDTGETWWR